MATGAGGDVGGRLAALASKVDSKIYHLKDVLVEYMDIKSVVGEMAQEREMFQHEQNVMAGNEAMLEAMKEELVAANNELVATKEDISRKNQELEFVKKKLQESEARSNQAEQQSGIVAELIQPRGVQTRSMQKRKGSFQGPSGYGADDQENTSQMDVQSPGHLKLMTTPDQAQKRSVEKQKQLSRRLLYDAGELESTEGHLSEELVNTPNAGQTSGVLVSKDDDLEAIREELIKGFLEIDIGGRKLGIKEMGELNEKAFQAACLAKLPPEEAGSASYELYSSWQKQLSDLSWNPFKKITVDGACKEIVNVDDAKLQELKSAWGEGAHKAVVNALMEMKEYNTLGDRSIAYELWNYKEGRKATLRECVEYITKQVKQLTVTKRRKTRRW
ncbi:factor of DNA methylation 5-like isoform X2 [Oryza brachyantha]|uniref:factor of DNA methylation 5-like isoform X2 n=1 Tax=Oryza brachyantha TaxID=4533 RepID=UPI0007762B06|nr:factor of DNA methylation 5-like isoform X2 [Oryza brachyantha]